MNSGSVSKREWMAVIVIALTITVFLQAPYVLGYARARPGTEYTGLLINVEDGSYLSAMGQGLNGAWLYHLPFTTEPHAPVFIEVFYLALGHAARVLGLSAVVMWHLARGVADVILFVVLYRFIAIFLDSLRQRHVAYALAIFGAGYDFWRFPFDGASGAEALPIELHMPEAHLFYSALTFPHFAFGIALMLMTLALLLRGLNGESRFIVYALGAGVGNLLIGIVYPFLMYLIVAVTGAYVLFLMWHQRKVVWRALILLGLAFGIPVPLFAYYQIVLMTNPVIRLWNIQATTLSPHPLHFALAYAPLLVLGGLTIRPLMRADTARQRVFAFLWLWVIIVALLLYAPITQQRRFVEGVQVPLAILAAFGLGEVALPRLARTRLFVALSQRPNYSVAGVERLLIIAVIALASVASAYVWVSSVVLLGFVQPYPLFRSTAELQAMDWLRANASPEDVVLSAYWTGSFIPARAGKTVFVGHCYETIHFDEKRAMAEKFFQAATDDAWRVALLREYRIAYVFWGKAERDLGAFDPERASYLQRVFANDAARIYRVRIP